MTQKAKQTAADSAVKLDESDLDQVKGGAGNQFLKIDGVDGESEEYAIDTETRDTTFKS